VAGRPDWVVSTGRAERSACR